MEVKCAAEPLGGLTSDRTASNHRSLVASIVSSTTGREDGGGGGGGGGGVSVVLKQQG